MTYQPLTLWAHQAAARQAIFDAIKSGEMSGLVAMPTGSGKTRLFVVVARDFSAPALILTHRDELVRQTVEDIAETWPDASVGVIKAARDEWRDGQQVVVASVQSLQNGRLARMPRDRFGLIIADEAHHAVAPTWRAVIRHFDHRFLLGVTATPERFDGEGLDDLFGPRPLYTYPLRQAIKDGVLVPLHQYCIETETSLDGVTVRGGDFAVGQLAEVANTHKRNQIIVDAYRQHCPERRAVAFTCDVAHAKALAKAFNAAGVLASVVHGEMATKDRREIVKRFRDGDFRVLCNCEVLTEGWNDKGVSAVLMARPTKSRPFYEQCIGRALRRCDEEGKVDALILDFTANSRRHKLITALDLFGDVTKGDAEGRDVVDVVDREVVERARRSEVKSPEVVSWRFERVCPWPEIPSLKGYVSSSSWERQPATEKQLKFVRGLGLEPNRELTKGQACFVINRVMELRAAHPETASPKQRHCLKQAGRWRDGITRDEARKLIGRLKSGVIA